MVPKLNMSCLEIEFDEPELTLCECCGGQNMQLMRTIHDGENAVAMYMATLPNHPGLTVSVLILTGDFDDDAPKESRQAASIRLIKLEEGIGTAVTSPEEDGWNVTELATFLTAEQALSTISKELFEISDMIVAKDDLIMSYLTAPVTHH